MRKIPIIYHPDIMKYDFGEGHPFRSERFKTFMDLFHKIGLDRDSLFEIVEPQIAKDEDLEMVHTKEYIEKVKMLAHTCGHLSVDTYVMPRMVDAAKLIVGSAMTAARLIMEDNYNTAITFGGFHHAGVAKGEGFCLFNDVAIAAKMLLDDYQIEKVLIIDTDAHQGNGTMDIFYKEPKVLFISIHQDPRTLYPGRGFVNEIGANEGKGFTVNLPMPIFSGNEQWEYALKEIFVPLANEFQPDVIIRNGGADPHHADQLTNLGLDLDGLHMIGKIVRDAVNTTSKKLIDLLISGYSDLVSYGWLALISGVSDLSIDVKKYVSEPEKRIPSWASKKYLDDSTQEMVRAVKHELKDHWKCF